MNKYGYPESDWKLYKSKIADWQEGYMDRLCKEYIELLSSDTLASERFWALHNRIKKDEHHTGVLVDNSRSKVIENRESLKTPDFQIIITYLRAFSSIKTAKR